MDKKDLKIALESLGVPVYDNKILNKDLKTAVGVVLDAKDKEELEKFRAMSDEELKRWIGRARQRMGSPRWSKQLKLLRIVQQEREGKK